MTREEQIKQAALEECKSSELPDKEWKFRGVNSAYGLGFCEGAMWADKNPKDVIDWQRVRIQAAIAAMQLIQTDETFKRWVQEAVEEGGVYYEEYPRIAVNIADALVKELKGE